MASEATLDGALAAVDRGRLGPLRSAVHMPPPAAHRLRHVRWTLRSRLAERAAYLPLARLRHGHAVVTPQTELVIDGFTRTACTFAVIAFQLAQRRPVRVAHHLHAPSHIARAVRLGVPALLTIREPEGAVVSCAVREPYVTIPQALVAYRRFYERLAGVRERVVVGDFPEVTENLGDLVVRLNARFGTAFTPFESTPENIEECFRLIDERSRRPPWEEHIGYFLSGLESADELRSRAASARAAGREAGAVPTLRVARPTGARREEQEQARAAYRHPRLRELRERAERVYAAFTAAG
jgi:hypothetical protein